jgi:hypothetical protein
MRQASQVDKFYHWHSLYQVFRLNPYLDYMCIYSHISSAWGYVENQVRHPAMAALMQATQDVEPSPIPVKDRPVDKLPKPIEDYF